MICSSLNLLARICYPPSWSLTGKLMLGLDQLNWGKVTQLERWHE
jgi:hypothetical protein